MQRILVVGTSSSGKTSFGKEIAKVLNINFIDMDDINWQPGWIELSSDEFRKRMDELSGQEAWVIVGNYSKARDIIWPKADTLIWMNLPFPVVLRQCIFRTIRRSWNNELCCNGNQESFFKAMFTSDSIVLWVITSYSGVTKKYREVFNGEKWSHLRKVEFNDFYTASSWLRQEAKKIKEVAPT